MENLNRERARKALEIINKVVEEKPVKPEKFLSAARRLPVLIQRSGLLGTVAFGLDKVKGKQQDERWLTVKEVLLWLTKRGYLDEKVGALAKEAPSPEESRELLNALVALTDSSPSLLYAATEEAIAFSIWLSKIASAVIEKEEEE